MGTDHAKKRAIRKWHDILERYGSDDGARLTNDYLDLLIQDELRSEQAMACFDGNRTGRGS